MTPSYALFRHILITANKITSRTYDYAPDATAKYPFIWVQRGRQVDIMNNDLMGTLNQNIRIYGKRTDADTVDEWASALKASLYQPFQAFGFSFALMNFDITPLTETDNGTVLAHYSINAEFTFTKER